MTDYLFLELLMFCGFWFLIGAIDDFVVDMIWIIRWVYRRLRYYRQVAPISIDQLPPPKYIGKFAVLIPTWQEAAVITKMLNHCLSVWQSNAEYLIYVGCYPNDDAGLRAIKQVAQIDSRIRLIICSAAGPTTKADCLNHLWRGMVQDELQDGYKIKAIILHDAEDKVHKDELRLYGRLIEKNAAVQLPVIPIRVAGSPWISGHYCDEFAESHGKSMVVRESLGAALPLAGVGCAIERNILGRIALDSGQLPFDAASLTEDYELGLKIGALGGKTILARIYSNAGDLVGTQACFPATLETSVRQKSRWLTGIALAGWDRIGWHGSFAELWMLCRDRKAIFAALVLVLGYFLAILAVILGLLDYADLRSPLALPETALALLFANSLFLIWRLCMRALFVWRLYGVKEALWSVPRVIISNIIAIMAARRAVFDYTRHCFGAQLEWDKTTHTHFPFEQNND